MGSKRSATHLGIIYGLIAMACWGTVPVFMKDLSTKVDSGWTMNMYRYGIAALMYLPVLITFALKGRLSAALFKALLFPTLVNTIGQILWAQSAFDLDPGMISIFIKTSLIWSTACSLVMFADERPLLKRGLFWIGILLSFGSMITLAVIQLQAKAADMSGLTSILICAFFWGLYPVSVKITLKNRDVNPRLAFSVICVNTAVILAICGSIWGSPSSIMQLSLGAHFEFIASAVLGIGLSHITYYYALKLVGVIVSTNLTLITPFYTLLLSILFGFELFSWPKTIFGTLIITGAVVVTVAKSKLNTTS